MASRIAEAYVQIVPRIDGIGSSVTKGLSGQMGKAGEESANSFAGGFKKFAGPAIAAGIAVAGAALFKFGKDSIKAAEEARVASQRIDSIAESMNLFGNESKTVSSRIQAYAESQERLIAVDADVIKGTQAKLLTFKEIAVTADEAGGAFDRATMAAVDLAAAGFGSAESNAVQLGKALNDPIKGIGALTRSGITFTESEKDKIKTLVQSGNILEAQNMILGAIETQVGGTAAATATSSEKMRLGFESVKDAVGAALLPAFDGLADFSASNVFPTIVSAIEKLPSLFTSAGAALFPFVEGFKTTFTQAGGGIEGFIAGLMDLRQKLFDAFITALPGIIDAVVAFIPTLVQNSAMMITSLITAITQSLPAIIDGAILLFNGIIAALTQVLPTIIAAVVKAIPAIVTAIVGALPAIIQGAIQLFIGIIDGLLQALPQIISALVKAIPQIIKAITDALPALIKGAIELFLGIVQGLVEALPQIIDAVIDAMPQIVKAIIDAVPLFIDAGMDLLKGLAKGMLDNLPRIIGTAIEGVANFAIRTFKNLFGIKSPSTVFADFGVNMMDGLALGIISTAQAPLRALETVSKQMGMLVARSTIGRRTGMLNFEQSFIDELLAGNGIFSDDLDNLGFQQQGFMNLVGGSDQLAFNQSMVQALEYASDFGRKVRDSSSRVSAALGGFNMASGGIQDFLAGELTFMKGNRQVGFGGGSMTSLMRSVQGDGNLNERVQALLDQGFKFVSQPGLGTKGLKDILAGGAGFEGDALEDIFRILGTTELSPAVNKAAKKIVKQNKKSTKKPKTKLALGGFVTGPTNALIGEAGPELVYPLDRFEKVMGLDNGGNAKVINYYAAPNQSLDAEKALFTAMKRAKVIVGW